MSSHARRDETAFDVELTRTAGAGLAAAFSPLLAKRLRLVEGQTQFKFAERASVSYARYQRFEQGRLRLRPDEVRRLADSIPSLKATLTDLLLRSEPRR